MTRYVAGFVFATGAMQVMLIQKKKPAWQAGRLNAVGGKIEQAETAQYAMMRECYEETNIMVPPEDWRRFCVLRGTNNNGDNPEEWEVHFFTTELPCDDIRGKMRTRTAEPVDLYPLHMITSSTAIPNLPWLIAMARNMDHDLVSKVREYVISEQY